MKFEPLNLDTLRNNKEFTKATKKAQKDSETMIKRQKKEKETIQKNQIAAIERIAKGKKYVHYSFFLIIINIIIYFLFRSSELVNDPSLKQLVAEQTKEWSEMIGRHLKEEWTTYKEQLEAQKEILKTVLQGAQSVQQKQLTDKFEKQVL